MYICIILYVSVYESKWVRKRTTELAHTTTKRWAMQEEEKQKAKKEEEKVMRCFRYLFPDFAPVFVASAYHCFRWNWVARLWTLLWAKYGDLKTASKKWWVILVVWCGSPAFVVVLFAFSSAVVALVSSFATTRSDSGLCLFLRLVSFWLNDLWKMIGKSMMRGVVANASAFRAAPVAVSVRGMATERQRK